ncbi:hypothetical protein [Candidatus Methylacidithermus pantelleriae]|uniref:hypothetical protein n=1 Tax=Candidatus Methylacidithermus pantelleriae TaxID=2744239 RepID=UPI00157BDECD|nr:hypothetical protein [Candidatus Methylacidithermus pantelleriae]
MGETDRLANRVDVRRIGWNLYGRREEEAKRDFCSSAQGDCPVLVPNRARRL